MTKCVVLSGNIGQGFAVIGTFPNVDVANEYIKTLDRYQRHDTYFIMDLLQPKRWTDLVAKGIHRDWNR